jgi:hypothetical protein
MYAYQQANNADKMMDAAHKVLSLDGDDPEALVGVGQVLAERTRQAVQLPDNDHVTLPRVIEQPHQFRPVGFGPGRLLLIDAAALGALERIQLQVGFLGIGGDARVADLHGAKTPKMLLLCNITYAP